MPNPISPESLPDARAALNRALAAPNGIRMQFTSKAAVISFRFRCYTVRARYREMQAKIHPDIETVASPWEGLQFNIVKGVEADPPGTGYFLYIVNETGAETLLNIEEI